jgi:3-hydroxybutyryl-CoA dehydratase
MNKTASFVVQITDKDRIDFANLSGDFNPLHIDDKYASYTEFDKCVLHGAFSAGLFSRMAGMFLPGTECLLHNMRLKFVKPIYTPCEVIVEGFINKDDGIVGEVFLKIIDKISGTIYVDGSYIFGRHNIKKEVTFYEKKPNLTDNSDKILITGASGGLGSALLPLLGSRGLGVSTSKNLDAQINLTNLEDIENVILNQKISAIVHCAWPSPDNQSLTDVQNLKNHFEYNFSKPLRECLALAKFLKNNGKEGAILILIGSSFSKAGRHAWKMPLYSLAKSTLPTLVNILSLELSEVAQRIVGVNFDVIDGGMNSSISASSRQANADRMPQGKLPNMQDAAEQIIWILNNNNFLISGGFVDLTGGALP